MEPDLSEFDSIAPRKLVGGPLGVLSEEQKAKVIAAKAAGHKLDTILKVLSAWGVEVGETVLRRWLKVNG